MEVYPSMLGRASIGRLCMEPKSRPHLEVKVWVAAVGYPCLLKQANIRHRASLCGGRTDSLPQIHRLQCSIGGGGLSRLSHFILHFSAGCGSGDEMRTFLAITPGPSLLHPLPLSQGRIE